MEFIKPNIDIDFVGKRKIAYAVSLSMILISILSLIFHGGPKYGIDFVGGTVIQVKFPGAVTINDIKAGLAEMGLENSTIQTFGNEADHDYLIRTESPFQTDDNFSQKIKAAVQKTTGAEPDIRRVEMVGPQVGKDLQEKAMFAIFYAMLFIAIYISGRFEFKWVACATLAGALMGGVYLLSLLHISMTLLTVLALILALVLFWILKLKYAMGAVISLIHDVIITIGLFSLFDKEFSLPIIAAILSIMGYSLNDTIIVFDRIRENLKKHPKNPFISTINKSVNETLSRTILTSSTSLVAVLALFILGGGIIHDFAFAMLVGILTGTYSSVYVASPILLAWQDVAKRSK
ncbi:MAG: protein translocase subunit SecF [Deltaproteobacteria bacterium]|nr:protein translocase subunit SecF [Deltaproteobacteria bacterium]